MSSYEENCRDFALYGDQAQEDARYEENARYDRWDGYREQFYDNANEYFEEQWWASLSDEEKAAHQRETDALLKSLEQKQDTADTEVPF
jgi:hypothetical protein